MDQDILYHIALGSESHDLVEMFGDVKVGLEYLCSAVQKITSRFVIFPVHLSGRDSKTHGEFCVLYNERNWA